MSKPIITITFDDDYASIYSTAYPIMEPLGIKGSIAVIKSSVGGANITVAQLEELYQDGWDLLNHTKSHVHLPAETDENIVTQVSEGRSYLNANGWTRAEDIFVAPFNDIDERVLAIVKEYADCSTGNNVYSYNDMPIDVYRIVRRGAGVNTVATIKGWIDYAILHNKYFHLYFHSVGEGGGINYDPAGFAEIMEYVAAKRDAGLLDVMTMSGLKTFAENYTGRTPATYRVEATHRIQKRNRGTCLSFNGVDSKLVNLNAPITGFDAKHAFSAMIKPFMITGEKQLVSFGDNSTKRTGITLSTYGLLRAGYYDGSAYHKSSGGLRMGHWNHIYAEWDGTNYSLYINGKKQTGVSQPVSSQTNGIRIAEQSGRYWYGLIDEIRIWTDTLTLAEIDKLWKRGIAPRDNLFVEWLLNEGSGTTAIDTSGNGRDGTITNGTYVTV